MPTKIISNKKQHFFIKNGVVFFLISTVTLFLLLVIYKPIGYGKHNEGRINPQTPQSYTNKVARYSFQYSFNESIESIGGYEGPPEESDAIVIVDKVDNNISLMSISIEMPPTGRYLKNEQEAIKEIVGYWSGSTSQYLSPELNKITGPIKTTIRDESSDGLSSPAYRYEIEWRNDPKAGENRSGTDVWLLIPVSIDWQLDPDRLGWLELGKYHFLWLSYEKKDEERLLPILNSFTLEIKG
jgi:hypothetical protein